MAASATAISAGVGGSNAVSRFNFVEASWDLAAVMAFSASSRAAGEGGSFNSVRRNFASVRLSLEILRPFCESRSSSLASTSPSATWSPKDASTATTIPPEEKLNSADLRAAAVPEVVNVVVKSPR